MISPRNRTLGEIIYNEIDNNAYLKKIYNIILENYSIKLLNIQKQLTNFNLQHALRFADLLSKSTGNPNMDKHKTLAQELVALLLKLYPDNEEVKYYATSVLTEIGNYRGLQLINCDHKFSFLEKIFNQFDKNYLQIPYQDSKYFFHTQKEIFKHLDSDNLSYSGPTSMGKSLLMRMFIKDKILTGCKNNFVILVPTKALISEISSKIIKDDLKEQLNVFNYKVVTSGNSILLEKESNFIFILTPERLLYLLISYPELPIDYLFIDEAHKISYKDGRSAFYYKVIDILSSKETKPKIIFASPNIPNPEIYLSLIPNLKNGNSIKTSYSPVSQIKYIIDIIEGKILLYDNFNKKISELHNFERNICYIDVIKKIANHTNNQSIVYSNSKEKVVEAARIYARDLEDKKNPKLDDLAKQIKEEIHDAYFLADLIKKGVAYHIGYLPTYIKTTIENYYRDKLISILFCTSTLMEGVNLPADNLFVLSYKNANKIMTPVDFKNLIGRVGRIEYNLYGNVFFIRYDTAIQKNKLQELITSEVQDQKTSLTLELTEQTKKMIIENLVDGDVHFRKSRKQQSEKEYSLMRKFGLILLKDIISDHNSVVRNEFNNYLTPDIIKKIKTSFDSTNNLKLELDHDINISFDQQASLTYAIKHGLAYPTISNGECNYDELVVFLKKLSCIFKCDFYDKSTLGNIKNIPYYAVILKKWIEGNGLKKIISSAIYHKEKHPEEYIIINGERVYYEPNNSIHKNAVIAETLSIIERIILFTIANYFLRFSNEYKKQHNLTNFENDWYEYVEYGSTNPLTILLQRNGFTRETAEFIKHNKKLYVLESQEGIKLSNTLLKCEKESVKVEVENIKFNVPEIFID